VTDLVHAVTTAATQLPPEIQKSFFKAIGSLITGAFDLPEAWLEGKAAKTRAKTAAEVAVIEAAGKAAAQRFAADSERIERATVVLGQSLIGADPLTERAATFTANRLLHEQQNRESVAAAAIEELAKDPPTQDSERPVDEDWLTKFARVSEVRSDPEMQAYFAKILAGEIKVPGSFSPVTLDVASRLTTDVALIFQVFCNASLRHVFGEFVLAEPFGGNPGSNTLSSIGLSYGVLTQLQDAGLIHTDLTSYNTFPPIAFAGRFEIAGVLYSAVPKDPKALHPGATAPVRMGVVNFTRAGRELRRIVHMSPNPVVIQKISEFLQRFDLTLEAVVPEPAPIGASTLVTT
jgi:Protein of unknown function (DUF2806)